MTKKQIYLTIFFGIILAFGLRSFLSDMKTYQEREDAETQLPPFVKKKDSLYYQKKRNQIMSQAAPLQEETISEEVEEIEVIEELTEESVVISYIKKHHKLPGYYLTKSEAKQKGWVPAKGNLCEVLPGKAIGGDHFGNRERKLPEGNKYYEADVNYKCGRRNTDRVVFTKNGEVWLTKDHYKTFEKK